MTTILSAAKSDVEQQNYLEQTEALLNQDRDPKFIGMGIRKPVVDVTLFK